MAELIKKWRTTVVFLAVMLGFSLLNCQILAGEKPAWENWTIPGTPVRGGEYRVAATLDVGLLNPHHWPVLNWELIDMLYEQVVVAAENAVINPWILSSWQYRNPTTIVLKFREGVTFHDGSQLDAAAFKYNLEWVLDKKNGCWDRSYISAIKSMQVEDKHDLVVNFKKPFAIFPSQLQMPPGYGISPNALKADIAIKEKEKLANKIKSSRKKLAKAEAKAKKAASKGEAAIKKANKKVKKAKKTLAKLEKKFAKASKAAGDSQLTDAYPVGTGPFMFDSRNTGTWVKLKRNPNYWYGKTVGRPDIPYFDSVRVEVIPDSSIQLANLRVGKIHEMELSPALYSMLSKKKDPVIRFDAIRMQHIKYLKFNHAKGPCQDLRVRKAISHAIDRQALLHGVRFGLGDVASCIFPGDIWGHNPDLKPVTYDPELSRKLLKEAGYANGLTLKGHASNTPLNNTTASAIKNMLRRVGIEWEYDMLDAVAASDRNLSLEFDIGLGRWDYIYDPDMSVNGMYYEPSGINAGRSKNPEAIKLIEAGKNEFDFEKRKQIYWDLEKVLYENYEDAWLWWPKKGRAFYKTVRGYDSKGYETYLEAWRRSRYFSGLWIEK